MFNILEGDYEKNKPKNVNKKEFKDLLIKIQEGDYSEYEYELYGRELTHIFINISYRYNFKDYPTYVKQDSYMLFIQNWFLYGLKNYNCMGEAFSYVTQYVFNAFIYTIKKYKKSISEIYNFGCIEDRHENDNIDNFYDNMDTNDKNDKNN